MATPADSLSRSLFGPESGHDSARVFPELVASCYYGSGMVTGQYLTLRHWAGDQAPGLLPRIVLNEAATEPLPGPPTLAAGALDLGTISGDPRPVAARRPGS